MNKSLTGYVYGGWQGDFRFHNNRDGENVIYIPDIEYAKYGFSEESKPRKVRITIEEI